MSTHPPRADRMRDLTAYSERVMPLYQQAKARDAATAVLAADPGTGVMRHADAGYDIALDCAREHGLRLPGILGN